MDEIILDTKYLPLAEYASPEDFFGLFDQDHHDDEVTGDDGTYMGFRRLAGGNLLQITYFKPDPDDYDGPGMGWIMDPIDEEYAVDQINEMIESSDGDEIAKKIVKLVKKYPVDNRAPNHYGVQFTMPAVPLARALIEFFKKKGIDSPSLDALERSFATTHGQSSGTKLPASDKDQRTTPPTEEEIRKIEMNAIPELQQYRDYLKYWSEKEMPQYLKGYIPTEAMQIAGVSTSGHSIRYLRNPSQAVQIAAVSEQGDSIKYIKNPSEAVQIAACQRHGNAILHIKKPAPGLWSDKKAKESILGWYKENLQYSVSGNLKNLYSALVSKKCPWPEMKNMQTELKKLGLINESQLNESSANSELNRLKELAGIRSPI